MSPTISRLYRGYWGTHRNCLFFLSDTKTLYAKKAPTLGIRMYKILRITDIIIIVDNKSQAIPARSDIAARFIPASAHPIFKTIMTENEYRNNTLSEEKLKHIIAEGI